MISGHKGISVDLGIIDVSQPLMLEATQALWTYFTANNTDDRFPKSIVYHVVINGVICDFKLSNTFYRTGPGKTHFVAKDLGKPLGKGGFGAVVAAGKLVFFPPGEKVMTVNSALIIKKQKARSNETRTAFQKRIQREYEYILQAGHLAVMPPTFHPQKNKAYMVMRRAKGMSLSVLIKHDRGSVDGLNCVQRLQLTRNLLKALKEQVHTKKLVHRDIKPANMIVNTKSLEVTIVDFGLAKRMSDYLDISTCGTHRYMSYEQFNKQPIGQRADIYAMGKVIAELWGLHQVLQLPHPKAKVTRAIYKANANFNCRYQMGGKSVINDLASSHRNKLKFFIEVMTRSNPNERCTIDEVIAVVDAIEKQIYKGKHDFVEIQKKRLLAKQQAIDFIKELVASDKGDETGKTLVLSILASAERNIQKALNDCQNLSNDADYAQLVAMNKGLGCQLGHIDNNMQLLFEKNSIQSQYFANFNQLLGEIIFFPFDEQEPEPLFSMKRKLIVAIKTDMKSLFPQRQKYAATLFNAGDETNKAIVILCSVLDQLFGVQMPNQVLLKVNRELLAKDGASLSGCSQTYTTLQAMMREHSYGIRGIC